MGKKKANQNGRRIKLGKNSLQLSGFGFFSSAVSFACHQKKKRKFHTCLHIGTIEKSDYCFSEILPLHHLQVTIRYRGLCFCGSWLFTLIDFNASLHVYWHLKKHHVPYYAMYTDNLLRSLQSKAIFHIYSNVKLVPEPDHRDPCTCKAWIFILEPAGIHPWIGNAKSRPVETNSFPSHSLGSFCRIFEFAAREATDSIMMVLQSL